MCGIAGICGALPGDRGRLEEIVREMTQTLAHRGPDGEGYWIDAEAGTALGHRRLAILDRTSGGHQPMLSPSSRYVLVFNGEIYNYVELRERLSQQGWQFRGRSDTEVLLAAFEAYGVQPTLSMINGMFALALWDRPFRRVILARDAVGKKPLYYGVTGSCLLFGSELKAVLAHPQVQPRLDQESLALFLRFSYVPGARSIYENFRKIAPGSFVTFDFADGTRYLGATDYRKDEVPQQLDDLEAEEELLRLLRAAVGIRLRSDVPLGSMLSGGIDSSLITALAQEQSLSPLKTFSLGFRDARFDESPYARAVAHRLGTEHFEYYLEPQDVLEVIHRLPTLYDEPFADSSQLATVMLCQKVRQEVSVALSGDGGDELFFGYKRYFRMLEKWAQIQKTPLWLRRWVAAARGQRRLWALLTRCSQSESFLRLPGMARLWRQTRAVAFTSLQERYTESLSSHPQLHDFLTFTSGDYAQAPPRGAGHSPDQLLSRLDAERYLPDDILVKVDRASMGSGLEIRSPMLDRHVMAFALSRPARQRHREGSGKWLLRRILARYLPEQLFERPKQGFNVPLATWLRGPLRAWANDLLADWRLRDHGLIRVGDVHRVWDQHCAGSDDNTALIWNLLIFQQWFDKVRPRI